MYSARRIFLLLLSLGISIPLLAQTDTARLTGTVTDPNGAVVAGATVTVTNLGTQRAVTVQSDQVGNYVVAALPPGQYQVELKQTGFRTVTQQITLQTQQVA
jgi:carboxypeptidase family protein